MVMTNTAYQRYLQERTLEERKFQKNKNDYLKVFPINDGGTCQEIASDIGHCDRIDDHYTHEARSGSGKVLGRWRIRKVVEVVDPLIPLPE